ncbi:hypothetical protein A6A40_24465 (plasmid) [Azospirillum humicireducens]|uniref:Cyclic nucleotide-binding domain-containing protein n=2 Tax=Azospirillum humicireducens TaxID=1226968 RepID=A0A2R4VUT9_9PROT|nr:hypothetical protein A6A40_24465 [Azospirillum humicireducens]
MTAEAIEDLTAAASTRLCDGSEAVCGSEDLDDTLCLIASGIVAVGLTAPDQDKRIVFDWAGPGEVVGEFELPGNGEKPQRVTDMFALTTLSAVTIPGSAIRATLERQGHPLASKLATLTAGRRRRMAAVLTDVAFIGLVETRLARCLPDLGRRFGRPTPTRTRSPAAADRSG